jgi:hypothetical protein
MRARSIPLLCVLLASAGCRERRPQPAPSSPTARAVAAASPAVLDPKAPLQVELVGEPVHSVRTWTTALAPNPRGGWNFITQAWEVGSATPPEYVIVDLEANTYTLMEGSYGAYAVSKYQVKNELRAANGRIFFPLAGARLAYYDPAQEVINDLGSVVEPGAPDKILYDAKFGPDGMLYAGTQSRDLPTIVQIDPDTLKTRVLGHVGHDRHHYSYAYEIAIDLPWIYATVGESPWELAAINVKTGESRILATRSDRPWMKLKTSAEGVLASLITGVHTAQSTTDHVWCIDGKISNKPPAKPRALIAKQAAPLAGAPELDLSELTPDASGAGHVRWRAPGSSEWKVADFRIAHMSAIDIEALAALPDGSVLGGARQYHGFFRYDPHTKSTALLSGPGPSGPAMAMLGGTLYMAGYPNGVLYAYDPRRVWTAKTRKDAIASDANPRTVGNFTDTDTKYGYFLRPWHDRVYYAGRRERTAVGSGIGYYEPKTNTFRGHHDRLDALSPEGLAVLPQLDALVFSGKLRDDPGSPPEAELIEYDAELAERARFVVKPGLRDTGAIFATPTRGVILGFISDAHAVYRYDVIAKQLVGWKELGGKLGAVVAQRPDDDSMWVIADGSLVRIDPQSLETTVFGQPGSVPAGVDHMVWQGPDLYLAAATRLYRIAHVGLR